MRRADILTTFMCRLSRNSGTSTSCNPKGLPRPVAGKLYLFFRICVIYLVSLKINAPRKSCVFSKSLKLTVKFTNFLRSWFAISSQKILKFYDCCMSVALFFMFYVIQFKHILRRIFLLNGLIPAAC